MQNIEDMNKKPLKLLRQVTSCDYYLGNPIADAKFKMNNKINKLKKGDYGYLPSSKSWNSLPIVTDYILEKVK